MVGCLVSSMLGILTPCMYVHLSPICTCATLGLSCLSTARRIVFSILYHDSGILLNFLMVCMNELTIYNEFRTHNKSIGAVCGYLLHRSDEEEEEESSICTSSAKCKAANRDFSTKPDRNGRGRITAARDGPTPSSPSTPMRVWCPPSGVGSPDAKPPQVNAQTAYLEGRVRARWPL
jgi:hypothetical protein